MYRYYGNKRRSNALGEKLTITFSLCMVYIVLITLAAVYIAIIVAMYMFMDVLIPTLLTVIVLCVLIKVFYFNKIGKRVKFNRKLKKLCKKRMYKLNRETGFWRSTRLISEGYHFTVETPQTKYFVRYITCFDYNTEIIFQNKNQLQIRRNINAHKNKFKVIAGINETTEERDFRFDTVYAAPPKKSENIVLLNPVPREVEFIDRDGMKTPTGSGDKFFGYTIYNGTDFLKQLKNQR